MSGDLFLRRKWTLRAHGNQVVFVKRANERTAHVLMKAFLWALYLPAYPDLTVEVPVGDRYKPDVVSVDCDERPRFWAEAGQVGIRKIHSLGRRYRDTHFALAKWNADLDLVTGVVSEALAGLERAAPFDIISFPKDSGERFVDDRGQITVRFDDLAWTRLR